MPNPVRIGSMVVPCISGTGLITAGSMGNLYESLGNVIEGTRAVVIDLRRAVLLLDFAEWVIAAVAATNMRGVKMAVVVSHPHEQLARDFGRALATHGMLAVVTTEHAVAYEWAAGCE